MKIELSISDSCIKCRKCVKVCPAEIFSHTDKTKGINITNSESCIVCGHCVAACPTDSVIHSEFPIDKVHKIDRTQIPTAEQVMLLCKTRRSNRAFSKKPIPRETLEKIIEAAHRAPTGSNVQNVSFTVITNPEKLNLISNFTIGVFAKIVKKLENPILKPLAKKLLPEVYKYVPNFKRLVSEKENGNDVILRGATAVILIHTPKSSRFGISDASLAYQNGSLMAESLQISQFYTGFVCAAMKQTDEGALEKMLGIDGKIQCGMALGVPEFMFPKYIDKKEADVNYI